MYNFVEKYWRIIEHPLLNLTPVQPVIEVQPYLVNPLTNSIDDNNSLNTKIEFWVEFFYNDGKDPEITETCHDYTFDCGGDTYEEAINALYELVINHYGDYDGY